MTKTEITKNTTFKLCIEVQNDDGTAVDLTGYTGEMAITSHYKQEKLIDTTVTIDAPNKITVLLTADQTKELPESTLYGTLQVKNASETILIEQFQIFVNPNTNL